MRDAVFIIALYAICLLVVISLSMAIEEIINERKTGGNNGYTLETGRARRPQRGNPRI